MGVKESAKRSKAQKKVPRGRGRGRSSQITERLFRRRGSFDVSATRNAGLVPEHTRESDNRLFFPHNRVVIVNIIYSSCSADD